MTINMQDKVFEELIKAEAVFKNDNKFYIKFDSIEVELTETDTKINFYYKGEKVYSTLVSKLTKNYTLKLEGLVGAIAYMFM